MKLIIYTINGCFSCEITKKYLEKKNIEYIEKNVNESFENFDELRNLTDDYIHLPKVLLDDKFVSSSELMRIFGEIDLLSLIEKNIKQDKN